MSKVIPATVYRHVSGRTVTTSGACPWHTAAERADWVLVRTGFTVQHPDGTTGIGRPPFRSAETAQAWCDAHPHFPGMSQN